MPETEMYETEAFGKKDKDSKFEVSCTFLLQLSSYSFFAQKMVIKRGEADDSSLELDVLYCGVCHGDVDFCNNAMGSTIYPIVPGHEIAGVVTKVGS